MAEGGGKQKHGKGRGPAPVIADPRFAKLHSDPRFQRIPRGQQKVAIDPRFEAMFKDPAFQTKFVVDKRGRKKKGQDADNLEKYYRLEKGETKGRKKGEEEESKDEEVVVAEGDEALPNQENLVKKGFRTDQRRPKKGATESKVENAVPQKRSGRKLREESDEDEKDGGSEFENDSDSESGTDSEAGPGDRDVLREGFGSDESSSSEDDEESELEDEAEDKWEEPEKVPTSAEETRRLAIVNLDWEYIRAVDILVMLKSFLPESGSIESVTVYPSDFGLERMKEEEVKGPQPLWGGDASEEDDDESDEDGAGVNMEKLREYEKSKLKYYYAVVSCDAPATAAALYAQCDGLEFEKSSNKLDLRFVPDAMSFDERPKRDTATAVPSDYAAPDFETRALQHSNVKLTWDEDEPARRKTLRRKFGKEEVDNMDFHAYMASSDSDSDEEGSDAEPSAADRGGQNGSGEVPPEDDKKAAKLEKREKERERLRALLLGDVMKTGTKGGGEDGSEDEDEEMEITFNTGLNDLGEKLEQKRKEKEQLKNETTWEAYLRKKKERRKGRKKGPATDGGDESDASIDDPDGFFQHDENPFDDPFFADDKPANGKAPRGKAEKGDKKTERELEREKKREEAEAAKRDEARRKADLELLMMDDDLALAGRLGGGLEAKPAGYNLKAERRKEKEKLRKKKKGERVDEDAIEDEQAAEGAKVDFEDPRFGALFSSHHFAIDPTDPRFSKSAGQMEVLAEKQRRRMQDLQKQRQLSGDNERVVTADESAPVRKQPKAELSSLVKSLKRKVEAKATKESRNKETKRTKATPF
ncbi:hypothetical protein KFL_003030030 [Klebsormidium nitens]|uniref:Uncharacterized protein n=1 Tax=Klebsormidium nitens TaxID=105231 RepID=A0A1Y1I6T7_KLENI|nr:hypothetical protein KFL_003030030 [Klebsormidium nitens]|eukprot:GAQ86660.1 hypothetical protein KFL_003030030 [Klebsormidium nitens]